MLPSFLILSKSVCYGRLIVCTAFRNGVAFHGLPLLLLAALLGRREMAGKVRAFLSAYLSLIIVRHYNLE